MVKTKQGRGITHGVMVRVAFSPSDMGDDPEDPRMPSSQPVQRFSLRVLREDRGRCMTLLRWAHTTDNTTNTNFCDEIAPSYRRVKPHVDVSIVSMGVCSVRAIVLTGGLCDLACFHRKASLGRWVRPPSIDKIMPCYLCIPLQPHHAFWECRLRCLFEQSLS